MPIRKFLTDLLKQHDAGDGGEPPAEPADTPAPTPADGDDLQDSTDDDTPPGDGLEGADAGDGLEGADAGDGLEGADAGDGLEGDALARRLHAALVQLDGRVSDPAAVTFDPAHLDGDGAALTAAIDDLVEKSPAIRSRQYGGDIGAGSRGSTPAAPVDLIQLMRGA